MTSPIPFHLYSCLAVAACCMLLTAQSGQLVAGLAIGVADLKAVLDEWVKSQDTRAIWNGMDTPEGLPFKKPPIGS